MPKVNSNYINNNEKFLSSRNLSYLRLDDILGIKEDINTPLDFIEDGGVIFSKLPKEFKNLPYSFVNDLQKCMQTVKTVKDACVWKGSFAKKLYLDKINLSDLNGKNKEIIEKLISTREILNAIGSKICSKYKIIDIENIVYPSETIGRELHLDRHDKSKDDQSFRTIKLFLNLSPNSSRIWGIGPSRPQ